MRALWSYIFSVITTAVITTIICIKYQGPIEIPKPPDTIRQDDSIRILLEENTRQEIRIRFHWAREDSFQRLLKDRQKFNHEINQINNFTPDSRLAWHDSVMRAAGLR